MGEDTESRGEKGEAIDEAKEQLQGHDTVDEFGQDLLGDDGMLFDELRQIIESGGCVRNEDDTRSADCLRAVIWYCLSPLTNGQGQETEAHDGAKVAHQRENPHARQKAFLEFAFCLFVRLLLFFYLGDESWLFRDHGNRAAL